MTLDNIKKQDIFFLVSVQLLEMWFVAMLHSADCVDKTKLQFRNHTIFLLTEMLNSLHAQDTLAI